MKNLLKITIALFALIAFSGLVNAQTNTGITPAIGTIHEYWVNSTADGSSQNAGIGNEYQWFISTDAAGANKLPATNADEFVVNTTGYDVVTTDLVKMNILWKAASATKKYFLHVIETNSEGCSNHKAQVLKPFSNFELAVNNVDKNDFTTNVPDYFSVCAPDVVLTEDAASTIGVKYDYGTTKLYYKIDATGMGKEDYTLGYKIHVDNTKYKGLPATATIGSVTGGAYANEINLVVEGDQTVVLPNAADNNQTKYVCVELENGTFEGLAEHMVTVTLLSGQQKLAVAKLVTGQKSRNQVVPARPATTVIQYN